ncbi:MAG: nucleotidyl transferase AbiEii/AbiGii toxin family protein [Chlamydiae bacterium]|nr:nucleotidyl transferase AbiEii/AbiGii toxin family protein [Chlamydiota bacterium]MBI3267121.1 nucleotidyl transferase AbiEii/AbiGii toxin family protein [Chlamydiota bacterium]
MNNTIKRVIKALEGKMESFPLGGGTALSLFYFQHRLSYDLDFFTQTFSRKEVEKIITELSSTLKADVQLTAEVSKRERARILVYNLILDKENSLKIDFIEDLFKRIGTVNVFNGIPVLSLEDIYLRKIYAACGVSEMLDEAGRKIFLGGRQEVKDFFDLFFLSKTFMSLSKFASDFCSSSEKESIIAWYRKYNCPQMKMGLSEIQTDKRVSYQEMERHFKDEVEALVRKEVEG